MTSPLTLRVLYFAQVAERTGQRQENWEWPQEGTVQQWTEALLQRHPNLSDMAGRLHVAVNQFHAKPTDPVRPGDEVAVFERVTGGCDDSYPD